jgi:hypothetical protein
VRSGGAHTARGAQADGLNGAESTTGYGVKKRVAILRSQGSRALRRCFERNAGRAMTRGRGSRPRRLPARLRDAAQRLRPGLTSRRPSRRRGRSPAAVRSNVRRARCRRESIPQHSRRWPRTSLRTRSRRRSPPARAARGNRRPSRARRRTAPRAPPARRASPRPERPEPSARSRRSFLGRVKGRPGGGVVLTLPPLANVLAVGIGAGKKPTKHERARR